MTIRKIIRLNLWLVIAIGLYGFVTDEPYWRDNGHDPWLYDYFFWFALVLNGPSGFAADYLSWFTSHNAEWRFLAQYALWCALLWLQWKFYHLVALWSIGHLRRAMILYAVALCVMLVGSFGAYEAWVYGNRPSDFFIDRYFWFVRVAGVAFSGVVLLGYSFLIRKGVRSNSSTNRAPSGHP